MPLCKVESIKNVTDEIHKQWMKDNMWFEFYRPPFYIPMFCEFSDETIKRMKEEYDKGRIETIWINDVDELFDNKKIKDIIIDEHWKLIRFFTHHNKLLYDVYHDQHILGFTTLEVGRTSDVMIDKINIKLTSLLINR